MNDPTTSPEPIDPAVSTGADRSLVQRLSPSPAAKRWLKPLLRWGIFIVGVAWIGSQLTLRDRVNVVLPDGTVSPRALLRPATDQSSEFYVEGITQAVGRADIVSQPDRKSVAIYTPGDPTRQSKVQVPLWGLRLRGNINKAPEVDSLVVKDPAGAGGIRITPDDVVGGFNLQTPRPVVEKGIFSMVRDANPWLLLLAILIFPLTIVLTAVRWNAILSSQDVRIPFRRVCVLNMVGNFYNSFMPGSTGGDFLKAYYTSRLTPHKIRAIISVFIDRVIGLLALVILGGVMATYQYVSAPQQDSPTAQACLRVALVCGLICVGSLVMGLTTVSRRIRRAVGFDWVLARLPMQHHLEKVREAGRLYRRQAIRVIWWILVTFPVHITVVLSAMIAGHAFGLSIAWPYYFVCVPVMVLVAAIPISPQGAGVMEWFGFLLLAKQGATVSEVLALTLSIRFVQILWNLVGGIFVLRGSFATPHTTLDAIADEDDETSVDAPRATTPSPTLEPIPAPSARA